MMQPVALRSAHARKRRSTLAACGAIGLAAATWASGCSLGDFDSLSSGLGGSLGSAGAGIDEGLGGSGTSGSAGTAGSGTAGTSAAGTSATAGSAGTSGETQNLIVNPGFESGTSRWSVVGSCNLEASTDSPHSGNTCLLVSNRTESWQGPGYDLMSVGTRGASYAVSVWARTSDASYTAQITYKHRCVDETGDATYSPLGSNAISAEWSEIDATLTVPDCVLSESLVYIEGPPPGVDFYIDDTSLTLLPP